MQSTGHSYIACVLLQAIKVATLVAGGLLHTVASSVSNNHCHLFTFTINNSKRGPYIVSSISWFIRSLFSHGHPTIYSSSYQVHVQLSYFFGR